MCSFIITKEEITRECNIVTTVSRQHSGIIRTYLYTAKNSNSKEYLILWRRHKPKPVKSGSLVHTDCTLHWIPQWLTLWCVCLGGESTHVQNDIWQPSEGFFFLCYNRIPEINNWREGEYRLVHIEQYSLSLWGNYGSSTMRQLVSVSVVIQPRAPDHWYTYVEINWYLYRDQLMPT